jgi:hypothetical protein
VISCAISLGWDEGVEIRSLPLKTGIEDGWVRQSIEDGGKPTKVVTHVDGGAFSEFWFDLMRAV